MTGGSLSPGVLAAYRLLADVGRRRLAGEREAALAQDDRSGQARGSAPPSRDTRWCGAASAGAPGAAP